MGLEQKEKTVVSKTTSMINTRTSIKTSIEAGVIPEEEEEEALIEEIEDQEEDSIQEEVDKADIEKTARRKTLGWKKVPRNLLQAAEGAKWMRMDQETKWVN